MMNKVKALLTRVSGKAKCLASAMAVGCTAALATVVSSAEETTSTGNSVIADYSDQIINQFTSVASDIVPVVVGIIGAGLGVFAVFLAVRFGKKMFNTVSK